MSREPVFELIERELIRVERELAAQRKAYYDLLGAAEDKMRQLGQARHDRDQYLAALRKIESTLNSREAGGKYFADVSAIRSCYADVPGVVDE